MKRKEIERLRGSTTSEAPKKRVIVDYGRQTKTQENVIRPSLSR